MSELIDTTEMYLRTVVELEEEGVTAMRARIAERLQQSSPTVSQTVARMERDGLLTLTPDRSLALTAEGKTQAIRVMRRHRIAECMLLNVLKLPLAQVHDEACKWEHVLNKEVELRAFDLLDHPTVSPFGCPIPGLEELGVAPAEPFLAGVIPLSEAQGKAVVRRMGENAQRVNETLVELIELGCVPGASVSVSPTLDMWRLSVGDQTGVFEPRIVADIFVEAQ